MIPESPIEKMIEDLELLAMHAEINQWPFLRYLIKLAEAEARDVLQNMPSENRGGAQLRLVYSRSNG